MFVSILEKIMVPVKYSWYFICKAHPVNIFNLFLIIVSSVKMGPVGIGWVYSQFDSSSVYLHNVHLCGDQLFQNGSCPRCVFSKQKEINRNQTRSIGTF